MDPILTSSLAALAVGVALILLSALLNSPRILPAYIRGP